VTFALKLSRNEQCAVIVFFVCVQKYLMQSRFIMHLVYGDKCFTRPTVQVWCMSVV